MLQLSSTDLNDPSTLELYSQILLFKNNHAEDGLVFYGPDKYRQWIFQSLAHKLDLECEYTLAARTLKISRPALENGIDPAPTYDASSFDDLLQNIGRAFGDALHSTAMSFWPTFGEDFSFEIPQYGMDASISGISDNILGFVNHEAMAAPVAGIDGASLLVEDDLPV
ncbi:hypothetical protein L207DRAFT_527676 [Hyaloscypha variabilis F]|uniref:Uncharacterized protein n=1 Tax=Hyaloscypha variabilis (strain UAMH 11265 / GT02V1 / F) TaxID=1149755 RepID=A0A2J6RWC1_HYAVF|nr:hypothetical protein L207DRAFT_527676 [Hyaloscypha variabilis F]